MKLNVEPTNGETTPTSEELLMKALIDSVTANGAAIRENTEAIRKLPDTNAILQELGKRMGAQEKRQEELVASLEEFRAGVWELNDRIEKMTAKLTFPANAVSELRSNLEQHKEFFEKPHRKEVHYRHFLGKPIWVLAASFLIISVLVVLLTRAWERSDEHATNDLKWRYFVLAADSLHFGHTTIDQVDQIYRSNPDQFRKYVIDEEDRKRQLYEQHQRATRALDEINKLEKKKKR